MEPAPTALGFHVAHPRAQEAIASRARQKLPTLLCRQAMREMLRQLREKLGGDQPSGESARPFSLAGAEDCGAARCIQSGLAEEPCWDLCTAGARSANRSWPRKRCGLCHRRRWWWGIAISVSSGRHMPDSTGVMTCCCGSLGRGRSNCRAPPSPKDYPVTWEASRWDGGKHRPVKSETTIKGRLIAVRVRRGKSRQWLYLFTTMTGSGEDRGTLRLTLEHRDGSAVTEADRTAASHRRQEQSHDGEGINYGCRGI